MWRLAESTLIAAIFAAGILIASQLAGGNEQRAGYTRPAPGPLHIQLQEN